MERDGSPVLRFAGLMNELARTQATGRMGDFPTEAS